jgi:hypothetical protein
MHAHAAIGLGPHLSVAEPLHMANQTGPTHQHRRVIYEASLETDADHRWWNLAGMAKTPG